MENSLLYSQFSPLNAGRLLGLCNFKIFWGSMPPDTHRKCRLLIQSVTLFKSAGYFNFYWNPCGLNHLTELSPKQLPSCYITALQSSYFTVKRTLQDSINEFVIRKLNPLVLLISDPSQSVCILACVMSSEITREAVRKFLPPQFPWIWCKSLLIKKFHPYKDFQSVQIQRSSRNIFTAHYACYPDSGDVTSRKVEGDSVRRVYVCRMPNWIWHQLREQLTNSFFK